MEDVIRLQFSPLKKRTQVKFLPKLSHSVIKEMDVWPLGCFLRMGGRPTTGGLKRLCMSGRNAVRCRALKVAEARSTFPRASDCLHCCPEVKMRKKAEHKSPGLMAGVSGGGSRVVKEDGSVCELGS